MKSILITGCNRGIGFGLVKHLSVNFKQLNHIFATCRNMDKAEELSNIASNYNNVHIIQADLQTQDGIHKVVKEVSTSLKNNGLDILINNAGISTKFSRLNLVKYEDLLTHFQINTIAPIILTKALIPELRKGNSGNGNKGIVINMSSTLGSIAANDTGGFYPYRTSKAALNAATKSMSKDLNAEITVLSLHPGWVKTDMGGKNAPLSIDLAVNNIMNFISNIRPEQTGRFFDADGKELSW